MFNQGTYDGLVAVRGIAVAGLCTHHGLLDVGSLLIGRRFPFATGRPDLLTLSPAYCCGGGLAGQLVAW